MGGHGALTLALKPPCLFKSLSAFAPICPPTQCAWGRKAFAGYLGPDESACASVGQPLTLRRHERYDHGYYFIATFMRDHLAHHAQALGLAA